MLDCLPSKKLSVNFSWPPKYKSARKWYCLSESFIVTTGHATQTPPHVFWFIIVKIELDFAIKRYWLSGSSEEEYTPYGHSLIYG